MKRPFLDERILIRILYALVLILCLLSLLASWLLTPQDIDNLARHPLCFLFGMTLVMVGSCLACRSFRNHTDAMIGPSFLLMMFGAWLVYLDDPGRAGPL